MAIHIELATSSIQVRAENRFTPEEMTALVQRVMLGIRQELQATELSENAARLWEAIERRMMARLREELQEQSWRRPQ